MSKTKDPTLKRTNPKTGEPSTYYSQVRASDKWEKKNPQEKIIIRVPAGARQKINAYVERMAAEEPDNPMYSTDKGRPSVNAMICALIEQEIGESLN